MKFSLSGTILKNGNRLPLQILRFRRPEVRNDLSRMFIHEWERDRKNFHWKNFERIEPMMLSDQDIQEHESYPIWRLSGSLQLMARAAIHLWEFRYSHIPYIFPATDAANAFFLHPFHHRLRLTLSVSGGINKVWQRSALWSFPRPPMHAEIRWFVPCRWPSRCASDRSSISIDL